MRGKFLKTGIATLLIATGISLAFAWGSWGHKHINRAAVFALPAGMQSFYYNHIDYISYGERSGSRSQAAVVK